RSATLRKGPGVKFKKSGAMQFLRRTIQITVLLFLIFIPLVNDYGIKVEQKDDYAIEQSPSLSVIHSAFKGTARSKVVEVTHKIKGSVWTMDILGFKISDPLAVLESTFTAMYFYLPMLLSAIVPVLFTVVLGRVYCGWVCPMHLLLEINDKLRRLLEKVGYNTRDIKFKGKTKYFVLILGLIAAYFAGMPLLSLIYPPAVISREIFYKIYHGFWSNGVLLISVICFFELILSRRWWCRYICPGGAVYVALARFRRLKIKRRDPLCDRCGDCLPVCPYALKPMTRELTAECDQCGVCVSVCKPGALHYTFTQNFRQDKQSGQDENHFDRVDQNDSLEKLCSSCNPVA
ncbi:MAG: 4Fe-4S binding protein, partial [bacterium]